MIRVSGPLLAEFAEQADVIGLPCEVAKELTVHRMPLHFRR
jgi:hypothetical protein